MNQDLTSRPLSSVRALSLVAVAALTIAVVANAQEKPKPAAAPAKSAPKAAEAAKPADARGTNVKGAASAPIKVVEFADFMCPACQSASVALRSFMAAPENADVNLTFKNFPLDLSCNPNVGRTVHNGACELALGAICASDLGGFWPYHDRIFSRSWELATRQDVIDNGAAAGIDKAKFTACLASNEAMSKLKIQIKEAMEVDVRQTPTLVINGKKLPELNRFVSTIQEERKKATAPGTK